MSNNYLSVEKSDYSKLVYMVCKPTGDFVMSDTYDIVGSEDTEKKTKFEDNGRNRMALVNKLLSKDKFKGLTLNKEEDYNSFITGETDFVYLYQKSAVDDHFVEEMTVPNIDVKYEIAVMTVENFKTLYAATLSTEFSSQVKWLDRFKVTEDSESEK